MDKIVTEVIGDVALIFALSCVLGAAARRCGQPTVVGQILASILLGPSLLGRFPGNPTGHLFPHAVLPYLTVLSQVAIVIFMFAVGYEIDFHSVRGRNRTVPLIAAGALLVPMALGAGSAWLLHPLFASAGEHAGGRSFEMFMAVAVSITALPVLAAIVRERGIAATAPGVVAVASAGIMDVTAWLVLAAALIGTRQSTGRPLAVTAFLVACFVAGMLFVVRPALRWWFGRPGAVLTYQVPIALILAMASAWISASIGLHAVFGGFLAGIAMRGRGTVPDADVLRTTEQTGSLLLPLFFVTTGLSVNIGALRGSALLLLVLIFVIGSAGKLVPAYAASRLSGLEPRPSATVAALLNTRGLTELIALNVGLDAGIIHRTLFTVLVMVALATTVMTGPLLSLISKRRPAVAAARPPARPKSRVLK